MAHICCEDSWWFNVGASQTRHETASWPSASFRGIANEAYQERLSHPQQVPTWDISSLLRYICRRCSRKIRYITSPSP